MPLRWRAALSKPSTRYRNGDYMIAALLQLFKGYIEIEAKGFAAERFITLAAHGGIRLWDIHRTGGSVCFKVSVKSFYSLHRFAKKSGVRLKITKKRGCPFFIYKYRKRYVFFAGFFAFLLLMLYMSSFIWLIEVDGNEKIEDWRILSVLNEKGLKTGAFKYSLNTDELEQYLKLKVDGISWLRIKIDGTRASITIVEEVDNPAEKINMVDTFSACDIIADRDAYITDIIATSGSPRVHAGDAVREGDVLISCDVTYMLDGEEKVFNRVCASGSIRGRVTRTITYTMPYTISLKRYTGNSIKTLNLKIFNANFNTNFLKKDVSFQKYDIIKEIKQLGLGESFILPVFIEKTSLLEYRSETITLSKDEAKQLAQKEINKRIITLLPVESDILGKKLTYTEDKNGITVNAEVTAIEDIGRSVENIQTQGGNAINGATENTNSE